jgi:hypothetical protein
VSPPSHESQLVPFVWHRLGYRSGYRSGYHDHDPRPVHGLLSEHSAALSVHVSAPCHELAPWSRRVPWRLSSFCAGRQDRSEDTRQFGRGRAPLKKSQPVQQAWPTAQGDQARTGTKRQSELTAR